ncbi:hypothetical protein [Sorangium sp. So ce394]|uniref:Secreted protein n=1 Tax=Sorangium cellulosum TaxID=56 RepID=A0A150SE62_SORCE|nr:hypothetical protein BE20_16950 [Sorangium cellulosum]KYF96852.1 hypothetical protein BE18_36220 [Sorangium cellulosum]
MRSIALAAAVCAGILTLAPACDRAPPVPETSDPTGKDLVVGAVVAATEKSGGIRIYKIVEVEDLPEPFGRDLHMIAYDPKVQTFQEAAELRRKGKLTVVKDHMMVRLVHFMPRDHRVISNEPVTDEERAPYLRSVQSRQR